MEQCYCLHWWTESLLQVSSLSSFDLQDIYVFLFMITDSFCLCSGHVWTAKWWTQNETPGSSSGVWTDGGACFARTAAPAPAAHATSASRVSSVSAKATTASHSVSIASSKPISHSASASVKETASASASVKETAITIASVSAEASKPSEVKRSRAFRPDYYL
jgi:hypothetical protein